MKHVARAFCAAVFLVGLLVFSQAQDSKQADSADNDFSDVEPARSFVAKSIQYRINPDGSKQIMARFTTYHKANGEYRQVSYGPDGPKSNNPLYKYSNDTVINAGWEDEV